MDLGVIFFSFRPQIVSSVLESMTEASAKQETELDAALKIQSTYRMWRVRRVYCDIRNAVICVQRVYRGHIERKHVMRIRNEADEAHERAVYEYYAARIQACFRGYYVRCYVDNFYARKRYIRETLKLSEDVRDMATKLLEDQLQQKSLVRAKKEEKLYKEAAEKLHHMVSTVSVSGIYRPPMSASAVKTVYGTNVEDDIRRFSSAARRPELLKSVKENLKSTSKIAQEGVSASLNTTKEDAAAVMMKSSQEVVENDDEMNDSKKGSHFMRFGAQRGAWNRSHVEGCSFLPPIANTSLGKESTVVGNVVQHSCVEDFTPLYNTESAELERCVNAKGMQALHGNKPFVVPAARRVPM
ncbi:putative spermatogenesis-associated protein 17-like [Trypanosoma theileri]|uniref:Putative spermatogenesis-associated protein 17-like n=1 Tax=Trypanosoma theileri TaxID=67003 RepID=A0A1X0P3B4_9TRYP|nr:putative spermatogenesis-associated protein 17-like [Trypanosoma theileri]ORC91375.1 putative spermatogenesis-associated protein 17-like [Trypanosoma theileri]